jgi:microcystin-dependent protein
MASSYTLTFSDPYKTDTVVVPSATGGSGKNNYDTSLELVGPGYTNYGQSYAQNFLKLLENSASPYPPESPIEGQLWYDTSDPTRKVLRINNGTDISSRWPTASGVFQQPNDPAVQFGQTLKDGDVWVDTGNSQLKIRSSTEWTLVGPSLGSGTSKTGSEFANIESNTGATYPVILNWVGGKVVEIISYNAFTPRSVIEGFSTLGTGTNLTSKVPAQYNGTAEKAASLVVTNNTTLRAIDLLRNNVTSQTHTGTLTVNSVNGLYVQNSNYNQTVQIYSGVSGGFVTFSDTTKPFNLGFSAGPSIKLDPVNGVLGINTSTTALSPTLDVYGSGRFTGALSLTSTNPSALSISGGVVVANSATIGGSIAISGTTTATGKLTVGSAASSGIIIQPGRHDAYDIGSTSTRFRSIYAATVGYSIGIGDASTATTIFYGRLVGTASRLETNRNFSITGQVSAGAVAFNGTSNVNLVTTLARGAIASQSTTATSVPTHTLLVLNTSSTTSSLEQISKSNFLADVYASLSALMPTGAIMAYGNASAPTGFLLCNGSSVSTSTYTSLYSLIGYTYGGSGSTFNLPNMSTSTYVSTGTSTGTYIKYIIKT